MNRIKSLLSLYMYDFLTGFSHLFQEAFTAIHGAELGTLIQHMQQKPLNLGMTVT